MSMILIVEDEPQIASFVSRGLQNAGYRTTVIEDGGDALTAIIQGDADLVLLDVGLPTLDGFAVLRGVREAGSTVPVIMLTARSSTRDTVEGLDAGASDYVPKPFAFEELLARVRSRLRETAAPDSSMTVTHGDVILDIRARRVTRNTEEIDLSAREFALAEQFLRNPDRVLSREFLLRTVWGLEFDPGSNIVDVYVRYLRAKLGPEHIVTVRGAGYRWQ